MKQIKKLASLLLAAVLAMTLLAGCGGRGGNVDIAITEQSLLKYINKTRANAEMGLSPVKNDPTLANAAAQLLKAYAETEMVKTYYGTGYKLSRDQVKTVLNNATGKNQEVAAFNDEPSGFKCCFCVAPIEHNYSATGELYLRRRANKVVDYGYGATFSDFAGTSAALASDVKVGIAFREIKGERFALVVYDVTNPEKTTTP